MQTEESGNLLVRVRNRVEECFKLAEAFYGESIPRCRVSFELTGTTAGMAHIREKLLRFNRKLLVDNEEFFMKDTIPHEVAHVVQYWKYWGKVPDLKPHGNEWKKIMVEIFRISPKRCHKLDTSKVKKRTKEYRYLCGCVGRVRCFGLTKHTNIQRGNLLSCTKCLKPLRFDGKGSETTKRGLTSIELD